jgi:glycosyltransferase involved in cell wall biosynthesis
LKLLFIGRFAEPKNNLAIIEISRVLVSLKVEFTLDVFGDAESVDNFGLEIKSKFLSLAKAYPNIVKYHGFKNSDIIFKDDYDFLLLPSLWEGFGLVMLEAASRGIIPVCSDVKTGPREFIANIYEYSSELIYPFIGVGGVLLKCPINDDDFKEWANCLESIYSNKELLSKLKYSGKENCINYSFENYRLNWENFLDSLILFN